MPLPLGHIDRSFAAGVLECSPRQHADQPLGNLDRRAAVGGLVERGVERRPTRPCGVDQLLVFSDELEHPWPVGALGGVGEGVSDFGLSLLQHLGQRSARERHGVLATSTNSALANSRITAFAAWPVQKINLF